MITYRSNMPDRPPRMARLPLDARGYPVPWFVSWIDGKPDFRIVRPNGIGDAIRNKTCWLCGEPRGVHSAFLVGPMCGVNRISSEPPSHRDCADYAARACPFMTTPAAIRNERGLDILGTKEPAGVMIKRNPGVGLLWVTKSWRPVRVGNGVLMEMGEPTEIRFYREGRRATRQEVDASVNTGLPLLQSEADRDGDAGRAALQRYYARFTGILDAMDWSASDEATEHD